MIIILFLLVEDNVFLPSFNDKVYFICIWWILYSFWASIVVILSSAVNETLQKQLSSHYYHQVSIQPVCIRAKKVFFCEIYSTLNMASEYLCCCPFLFFWNHTKWNLLKKKHNSTEHIQSASSEHAAFVSASWKNTIFVLGFPSVSTPQSLLIHSLSEASLPASSISVLPEHVPLTFGLC